MAEKCAKCSATAARVEIGGRLYCGSCGEVSHLSKAAPARTLNDLGTRTKPIVLARAANDLHQRKGMAKGGVVDLRTPRSEAAINKIVHRNTKHVPASRVVEKPIIIEKLDTAKLIPRSKNITRFHAPGEPSKQPSALHSEPTKEKVAERPVTTQKGRELPAHVETHHRAMSALAHPNSTKHARESPLRNIGRLASAGTAIAIMAGYVWLQNLPKLELHSASSKAGFALTLPAYLPSSYSLNGPVEASRGSATISFKSPSNQSPLKITQQVTTWDSSSLRDNAVAVKSSDFTSVQGQGLTIYLWGKTQAAWVNHGILYGIEGAGQLSREQILKIAYSL